jgi:hypothetical protein
LKRIGAINRVMEQLEAADPDAVLSGRVDWLDAEARSRLARDPLSCVETEFPHYVRSVDGPGEIERPSERHPVFYGCFDWHSAVHSHWSLVRGLRVFEDHPAETEVVETLSERFTPEGVAGEVASFEDHESFEKPYGWAWLLRLAAELHLWDDDRADEWRATLRPLEERIAELFETAFLTQDRPYRVGTHANSAFALCCGLDYARVTGDDALASATVETARRFFADDTDYPLAYEPLHLDFLSPGLTEADLMRRVLDREAFVDWLTAFVPEPAETELSPVELDADPGGGELHYAGLNLSRAWSMAGIAATLGDHPYADPLERGARRHAEAGLARAFPEDYAGSHWLSSFALYLLTRNEGGVAP